MQLFNVKTPFFMSHSRRMGVTVFTFMWAIFELMMGSLIFAAIFAVIGGYLVHQFFIVFDPKDYEAKEEES